jgi:manganese/iron transport system permease protein
MGRFLIDPYREPFMLRALAEVVLLGIVGAVAGVHVLLRRLAFLTDALQHTVFPGIALAFVAGFSLLFGALAAAALTIVLLVVLSRRPGVDHDAALALLISVFFAAGVVIVSHRSGYSSDLTALLFGRILDVDTRQLVDTAVIAVVCAVALAALHKELVLRAFDPVGTEALGYRVGTLDLVLDAVVALVVVAAVRAVGPVLVVAFLVTPAAAARLLCRSVGATMLVGAVVAAVFGWLGLSASYEASIHHGVSVAGGAAVVVAFTLAFLLAGAVVGGRRLLSRVVRPVRAVGA